MIAHLRLPIPAVVTEVAAEATTAMAGIAPIAGRVKAACPAEEYAAYKKATGKIVSRIVFDLLEPLYERNPGLKPPQWDE